MGRAGDMELGGTYRSLCSVSVLSTCAKQRRRGPQTAEQAAPVVPTGLGGLDLTRKALGHPGDLQSGWWVLVSTFTHLSWVLHEV